MTEMLEIKPYESQKTNDLNHLPNGKPFIYSRNINFVFIFPKMAHPNCGVTYSAQITKVLGDHFGSRRKLSFMQP